MDPRFQMIWFLAALICFVIAAFWGTYTTTDGRHTFNGGGINLTALGLAFFDLVFFWTAFKAI